MKKKKRLCNTLFVSKSIGVVDISDIWKQIRIQVVNIELYTCASVCVGNDEGGCKFDET